MIVEIKLKTCEVGLFKLPGIIVSRDININDNDWQIQQEQMDSWSKQTRCGQRMTEYLWSFRNEKQRDMFILRWS